MLEVIHTQTEEAKYYTSNRAVDIYLSMFVGLSYNVSLEKSARAVKIELQSSLTLV